MAPRDGDESRRPRQNQPAQPVAPDAEDDPADDIVDDDSDDNNSEDDSSDMDSDENEDAESHDERMQRLRTENEELRADRIEAEVTLGDERDLTERIREDCRRIEAQRIALIQQRERDLAELARIEAAAAQGEDPPTPIEEQSNQQEDASGGASANPDTNPDPSPSGSSWI